MITPVTPAMALSGSINVAESRQRISVGERPILPNSALAAPKSPTASNNGQLPNRDTQTQPKEEPAPTKDRTSTFAAAVIAGTLSPTPQTMEQLIIRIGASTIPEESQARLKDLIA